MDRLSVYDFLILYYKFNNEIAETYTELKWKNNIIKLFKSKNHSTHMTPDIKNTEPKIIQMKKKYIKEKKSVRISKISMILFRI